MTKEASLEENLLVNNSYLSFSKITRNLRKEISAMNYLVTEKCLRYSHS